MRRRSAGEWAVRPARCSSLALGGVVLFLMSSNSPQAVSGFNHVSSYCNGVSPAKNKSPVTPASFSKLGSSRFGRSSLLFNSGNSSGDDGGDFKDPNPGGLNQWGDSNSGDEGDGENFIDTLKGWWNSPEGKEDVRTYTASLTIALILRLLIIEPRYIPSLSMYPTFEVGDQLAVEKVTKRVRPFGRNQVVVFNPPQNFRDIMSAQYGVKGADKKAKEALIKRIVAVEGDEVTVRNGKLFVNGEQQDEPFTAEDAAYEFGPVVVPSGSVLVLGDNRNHSLDGHIWGFLPKENVIGRAVFIYWPPWRLGNEGMY